MIKKDNKRVTITMTKELYDLVNKISIDNNITISLFVTITIIDYLDKINKKNKGDLK